MANVLHFKMTQGTSSITYVRKAVSGSDVWLTFDLYPVTLPPGSGDFTRPIAQIYDGDVGQGILLENDDPPQNVYSARGGSIDPFAITTGAWHTYNLRFVPGAPGSVEFWVDGVQIGTQANIDTGVVSHVVFGLLSSAASWMTAFEFYIRDIKVGATRGATDIWDGTGITSLADFTDVVTASGDTLEVIADPFPGGGGGGGGGPVSDPVGGVRVAIAFDDPMLEESPTWTYLTDTDSLVAGYDIDRGRRSEAEITEPASATVRVYDRDGILDPTNSAGPYYGMIEPTLQIQLELLNPVTDTAYTRFRGFIDELDYTVASWTHQQGADTVGVTTLEISCVGLATVLSKIEMQPGEFGDTPPAGSTNTVLFDNADFQLRIEQVLGNAGITAGWYVVFTGNVNLYEGYYSPGQNPMDVIQDCCDAEFPEVSNAYEDRFGRLAVHGRLAKFDPAGTAASATPGAWDFTEWKCGDGATVAGSPTDTAHIRAFSFNRGWKYIVNSASASPKGITPLAGPGQLVKDTVSIGLRGICSWSKVELLTESGVLTGNDANDETKLFAAYKVANYAEPRNRITLLEFKSMRPDATGAAANWDLLCRADISDLIDVTVTHPGGGGFNLEPFFIEGLRETAEPANPDYASVTLSLDVSPQAYFSDPAGLDGA